MGTITIEQYSKTGGEGNTEAPVARLKAMTLTIDATTTTTSESITLEKDTGIVSIVADSLHRVSIGDNVSDNYASVDTTRRDFGVTGGDDLYYRLDA